MIVVDCMPLHRNRRPGRRSPCNPPQVMRAIPPGPGPPTDRPTDPPPPHGLVSQPNHPFTTAESRIFAGPRGSPAHRRKIISLPPNQRIFFIHARRPVWVRLKTNAPSLRNFSQRPAARLFGRFTFYSTCVSFSKMCGGKTTGPSGVRVYAGICTSVGEGMGMICCISVIYSFICFTF